MKHFLLIVCGFILFESCSSVIIRSPKHKSSISGPVVIHLVFKDNFREMETLTINDEPINIPYSCTPVPSGECEWIAPPLKLSGNLYTESGETTRFKYKLTARAIKDNGGRSSRNAFFNAAQPKWGAPYELYDGPAPQPTGTTGSSGGGAGSTSPVSFTSRGFDQLGTTTTTTAVYVNESYPVDVNVRIESSKDFALLSSSSSSSRSRNINVELPAGERRVVFYLHTEKQPSNLNRFFSLKASAPGYIEASVSGRVAPL